MAFVKPPARNMPPGSEPWAQWVEEQMSSVTKKSVEAYQYAERAAGGVSSALEGNVQNWDEINRVFEVTENSMQLADGAIVWSEVDPDPNEAPANTNVIWYTYDPVTREVLRMWQWGYYDADAGEYREEWYQAQLGADSIHDEAITSAKVALNAIDWDQIAPGVENTVTTAQETADKAAADLLIEKDRVNAELGPVKGDLTVLKTETLPALRSDLTASEGKVATLQNTTIPNLQTALSNVEGAAQSADKRSTVSTAAPSATTGFPQNAVWQRINASGAVIGSWRLSGSSWVAMPLDPVVIPNLSAGIITSGVINTNRLNASQVAAAVGSFLSLNASAITSGTINTNRLNAQGVAGAVGSFLSLNTGQITWDNAAGNNAFIGSLVGEQAFLERLYANRIVVSPDNMIRDPGFADASINAARRNRSTGAWFVADNLNDADMPTCFRIQSAGAADQRLLLIDGPYSDSEPYPSMPVSAGTKVRFSCGVRTYAGVSYQIVAYIVRADGTMASNGFSPIFTHATTGRADVSYEWTVPTDAVRAFMVFRVLSTGATGSFLMVGKPKMTPMVGSVLIEDGAVTADKIVANAITARELAVGAITADKAIIANSAIKSAMIGEATILSAHIQDLAVTNAKIANTTITNAKILNLDAGKITTGFLDAARIQANSITADKLRADAIDGKTITGVTITGGTITQNSLIQGAPLVIDKGTISEWKNVTQADAGLLGYSGYALRAFTDDSNNYNAYLKMFMGGGSDAPTSPHNTEGVMMRLMASGLDMSRTGPDVVEASVSLQADGVHDGSPVGDYGSASWTDIIRAGNNHLQRGFYQHSASVATGTAVSGTVTFPTAFTSAPTVVGTPRSGRLNLQVNQPTTTGFTWFLRNDSGASASTSDTGFSWIALGA